ncbi:MAG: hypothetical protein FWC47_01750 [Oscillospiraceae bacterium]|nr:hypothetical protein [Oscillospiraceae bacterium]
MFIEKLRKLSKAMQNEPDDIALITPYWRKKIPNGANRELEKQSIEKCGC